VAREPAVLDDPALFEQLYRFAIGHTIQWHRQVQLIGSDSEISTSHRDALRASVNPTRHLQNFVGTKVQTSQHVFSALDDVAEACIVDDDGVESMDVE